MNYAIGLEIIYKTIAYVSILMGLWLFVQPFLQPVIEWQIKRYKQYTRLKRLQLKDNAEYVKSKFFLYKHLELLLSSTLPFYNESSIVSFSIVSMVLFSVSSVVFLKFTEQILSSLVLGVLTGFIPYILLLVLLFWKRSETSYDLVPATNIFLGKYRVHRKDVYFALLETVKDLGKYKRLQKIFIKLTAAIQSHRSKEDLENAIELFVYQIGTSWAKQIGIQILNAQLEGKNIEKPLANIVKDMGKAQELIEFEKSQNQEVFQMGVFVPILVFPASIWGLISFTTYGRYLYLQFKTSQGFASFIVTILMCMVSFLITLILRKPKNEI